MTSEAPTHTCPKCKYVRKPTDDAPDWQCPSCGIAYAKFGKTVEISHLTHEQGSQTYESGETSFWERLFTNAGTGKLGNSPAIFFLVGVGELWIAVHLILVGGLPRRLSGPVIIHRSTSPFKFWLGILLLVILGISFFYLGWKAWKRHYDDRAKRSIEGAVELHREEWYAFKGQRVRVYLDKMQQPWFAVKAIAFILDLKVDKRTFQHYGPYEYGVPELASESCLSESGLRRLIRESAHPDAGALGIWLEREVLRVLRNKRRKEDQATDGSKQEV